MTVSAQAVSVLCRTPVFSVAMQISYFHVPAEMPQDLRPDAAVVIDVLRATTTIAWSLHNGAEGCRPSPASTICALRQRHGLPMLGCSLVSAVGKCSRDLTWAIHPLP